MEIWEIRWLENGEEKSQPLTCIWKVSDFERSLRQQGIDYATDYYQGSKMIKKSDRVLHRPILRNRKDVKNGKS